jgi:hypothetical protein
MQAMTQAAFGMKPEVARDLGRTLVYILLILSETVLLQYPLGSKAAMRQSEMQAALFIRGGH